MNRLTKYDPVNRCYKVNGDSPGRSIMQELGVYEDIHEEDIRDAKSICDVRDKYLKNGHKLSPYWEGKHEQ